MQRLRSEPLRILGRFGGASNATLLCRLGDAGPTDPIEADEDGSLVVVDGAAQHLAVYKPRIGEAPLWDFPDGTLYRREVAAYELAVGLGWQLVPPTVVRDGPHGIGSVQQFVAHDPRRHHFALIDQGRDAVLAQLRRMVVFDLLLNNADRKAGHVLIDQDEHVWLVDHGVTFHVEPKLRTVAWEFTGEPVPGELRDAARQLHDELEREGRLHARLSELLSPAEVTALRDRAAAVARLERFPEPSGPRPYPWPLL